MKTSYTFKQVFPRRFKPAGEEEEAGEEERSVPVRVVARGLQGGEGQGDRDGGPQLQEVPRHGQEEETLTFPVSQK